jgi:hypothetical protein
MDLKKFIQEEVEKLHKITLLESKHRQIKMKLKLLNEEQDVDSDLIEYEIPEWALFPLINGDYSSLENEDEEKLKAFINKVITQFGNAHFMLNDIDGEDNLGFRPSNDIDNLGGNVYRLYIKPNNSLNETKDVYAMYKKAGMEPPHPGKGIHTKKFHKCVTSVGDENGKNPYAICMSKLGKEKAVKSSHRTEESTESDE